MPQICRWPPRVLSNASWRPSGDQAGFASVPWSWVSRVKSEPSAFMT